MNFSQIILPFFGLKIYGILLALILGGVSYYYFRKIRTEKLSTDFFVHHYWKWIVSGMVGTFLFSYAINIQDLIQNPISTIFFWEQRFYGTPFLIFFFVAMYIDTKKQPINVLRWADLLVLPLLLGFATEGIASFLTGYNYGVPTDLFWGIKYETVGVDIIAPVHPVSLYSTIIFGTLFFRFRQKFKHRKKIQGEIIIPAILNILVFSFLLQFFRGNPTIKVFDILTVEQIIMIFCFGLVLFFRKKLQNI